jgi:hypothetical protein|tara:strand:- start:385 stop:651 length:267 start_codon:yes stop_codon:yes gene_type:complete
MILDPFNGEVGNAYAHTTQNRGHSAEELADMALNKIVFVGDNVPDPIKEQALAYRENLRSVLVFYMRQAMLSERTTMKAEMMAEMKEN